MMQILTPPSGRPDISLVLPALNEAEAIEGVIAEADAALRELVQRYEIIVVDDGSEDGTALRVEQIAATNPAVKLLRHDTNRGYGAALRSGFAIAEGDRVVFTDADSQFDLRELDRFLLLSQRYQVVCGYRIDRQDSPLRCFYSRVYNTLVRALLRTGVRDVDCALKMFHRETLDTLRIGTDGFLVNAELLTQARQQELSVVEVGVTHRPRIAGESTVSIWHIPAVLTCLLRYWWNQVQFPGADPRQEVSAAGRDHDPGVRRLVGWGQLLLISLAACLLLTGLAYPLIDHDETRYAEIPREMVVSGDWIVPQLNFEPYFDKPPLFYWLTAASYSLFGVSEWAARLVPAGSGIAMLIATMWFGTRNFGRRTGLLAATALLFSVGFLGASRILVIDGLFAMLTTLSLFAAYEAIRGPNLRLGWWLAACVACGLAFLAKGPIAVVLLVPPVFVFAWLTEDVSRPRWRHWLALGLVVAAIAMPWFAAVSARHPRFIVEFLYTHHIARFAGAFHEQPFWYFLPILLVGCHPWSFLLVPLTGFVVSPSAAARRRRNRPLALMLLSAAWCITFFSLSRCKLPPYVLPAGPPLALFVGHYLEVVLFSAERSPLLNLARNLAPRLAVATTCLVGVGFAVFSLHAELGSTGFAWAAIAVWLVLLIACLLTMVAHTQARVGWALCIGTGLLLASLVLHRDLPQFASTRSVFGTGTDWLVDLPDHRQLPVATIVHEWSGIPFGLGRNDVRNFKNLDSSALREFAAGHSRMLIVIRKDHDPSFLLDYLPEQTKVETVGQRGRARLVLATLAEQPPNVARVGSPETDLR